LAGQWQFPPKPSIALIINPGYSTMRMKFSARKSAAHVLALLIFMACLSCSDTGVSPKQDESFLKFTTTTTIKPAVHGGMAKIVITPSGGTLPYQFYVIPETQWNTGDQMYDMLMRNDFSRLYRYTYSRKLFGSQTFTLEVQPGTATVPRNYWVAVQDKGGKASISGTNMAAWWKKVSAYDL
jgi:hypothetical protein